MAACLPSFPHLKKSTARGPPHACGCGFWNPGCGFCRRMLPDLKEWEQNRPQGAPKLLVVSAGTAEANREMGLHSPVVLDQNFATGSAFGANGTPSAVLVDRKGRVASELAVGAPAVLELARTEQVT